MASEYCKFPHCECSMGAAERCKRIRTRPAPAATDTGLVTVAWRERSPTNNYFTYHEYPTPLVREKEELVTRSQAEKLLAAERAEKEKLEAAWLEAEGIISDLKADNAAKDALLKELEETKAVIAADKKTLLDLAATNGDKVTALEAKLAAAEQALERMVSEYDEVDLSHDEPPSMTSAVMEARAVLGRKPS